MWAVNEADLSAQNASGYVHILMLHYGLGVGLAVAELLPLLPPPFFLSKGAPCTLPVIMSSKMPSAVDAKFSCTGTFASFSKMSSSEATSNCSASGSPLTELDSLVLSSCSWRSVSGDAKPDRRKHLSMVSSRTLFQALLIYRMASKTSTDLMYVCPCIIYENDERYQLDATIYLLL